MIRNNYKGYTLVEMVVTVSIFSLAFLAIGAIFIGFTTAQSRANTAQRLLNESQFFFDSVVREIRRHAIDYNCVGVDYSTDDDYICLKSLTDNRSVHFKVEDVAGGKTVKICRDLTEPACDNQTNDFIPLIPSFLTVNSFTMNVNPTINPNSPSATDSSRYQPLVVVRMTVTAGKGRGAQVYDFQTTVTSRAYDF